MSKRKKWPHHAEWARMDSISAFQSIYKAVRAAQDMIGRGNSLEAMLILGKAADQAVNGSNCLILAKIDTGELDNE